MVNELKLEKVDTSSSLVLNQRGAPVLLIGIVKKFWKLIK
jgi:hypothetical protein